MSGFDRAALDRADIRFIQDCMRTPALSRTREQSPAIAWRDRHDQGALDQLILAYSRMVVFGGDPAAATACRWAT
jgi:RNA polymerase sigma-32 factor